MRLLSLIALAALAIVSANAGGFEMVESDLKGGNKKMSATADDPRVHRHGGGNKKRMSARKLNARYRRDNDESDVIIGELPDNMEFKSTCPSKYKKFVDALKNDQAARTAYHVTDDKQVFHSICLKKQSIAKVKMPSSSEQTQILKLHNSYRAEEDATDMFVMTWDDDLAETAAGWVSQCVWSHDLNANRDSPGRYAVGQNLAWVDKDHPKDWEWVMKFWHEEKEFFQYGVGSTNGKMVGHYTQLVNAGSYKVGCAYSDCGAEGHFWGCDYGPAGNVGGFKHPFTQGAKGSACGSSKNADGLCDCEKVDGNKDCAPFEKKDPATCGCVEAYEGAAKMAGAKDCEPVSKGGCVGFEDDFADCPDGSWMCCCTDKGDIVEVNESTTCKWPSASGGACPSTSFCSVDPDDPTMSAISTETTSCRHRRKRSTYWN